MTLVRTIVIFTVTVSVLTFIAFFGRTPAFRYKNPSTSIELP
jgi:palmitoyltransferase